MTRCYSRRLSLFAFVAITYLFVTGCASVAEGVTRAITDPGPVDVTGKKRFCELHSPAFSGIAQRFSQSGQNNKTPLNNNVHKVLMIHGIGESLPGYSSLFQNNLISALGMTRVSSQVKRIDLRSADYPGQKMGTLQITRYQNESRDKELHFFELTWSVITKSDKEFLADADSSLYSANRASVNRELKYFVNNHVVDPALYTGTKKTMIIESASQAICWMLHKDWKDLPRYTQKICKRESVEDMFNLLGDKDRHNLSFVTHSLGSRIMVDVLDLEVSRIYNAQKKGSTTRLEQLLALIKNFDFYIYMMSNQLPLLQLGRPPAKITKKYDEYCVPDGINYRKRFLNKLFIVAFSDPNDLLSYNIPRKFVDNNLDSRLCPTVVNVSVSVTEPLDLFGLGDFANPLSAHQDYEKDHRVIGLITHGIGQKQVHPAVAQSCKWLKLIDE